MKTIFSSALIGVIIFTILKKIRLTMANRRQRNSSSVPAIEGVIFDLAKTVLDNKK